MAAPTQTKPPPLRAGDRLTGPEFERCYDGTPGLKKAELVEHVVYVPSPELVDDTQHRILNVSERSRP
jgi:hypothetical protein